MFGVGCVASAHEIVRAATSGEELAAASETEPNFESRLAEILADMLKTNDDDFYAAASLVIDNGGMGSDFRNMMEAAGAAGSPVARYWLARYLLPTMETDPTAAPRAAWLLGQAADKGYVPAMIESSRLLGAGIGCEPDPKKAMALLMEACKQGSQRARAVYLASSGRIDGGKFDAPEMASELKKGNFYLEELIAMKQKDPAEAERWLRQADGHGSPFAPFALSQLEQETVSEQEAWVCVQRAAERHGVEAMGLLGTVLMRSELVNAESRQLEVKEDRKTGLRLLNVAAALGDHLASCALAAHLAENGIEDGDGNAETAYAFARYAAACGNAPYAEVIEAYCMATGAGTKQEAEKGLAMLQKAREAGNALALQPLASLYFNGDGVKADMRKAIDALGEDAAAGSLHAYAIMAAITALGNETAAPDPRAAKAYLRMANDYGDMEARRIYEGIIKAKGWRAMPGLFKGSRVRAGSR